MPILSAENPGDYSSAAPAELGREASSPSVAPFDGSFCTQGSMLDSMKRTESLLDVDMLLRSLDAEDDDSTSFTSPDAADGVTDLTMSFLKGL